MRSQDVTCARLFQRCGPGGQGAVQPDALGGLVSVSGVREAGKVRSKLSCSSTSDRRQTHNHDEAFFRPETLHTVCPETGLRYKFVLANILTSQ